MQELVNKAVSAGGKLLMPTKDEGFMLLSSLEDLDGHVWGIIYLDLEKFKTMRNK